MIAGAVIPRTAAGRAPSLFPGHSCFPFLFQGKYNDS